MESLQHAWNDLTDRIRKLPKRTQVLIAVGAILCLVASALFNHGNKKNAEITLFPDALSSRQISAYQIAFADAGLADYRIDKQKILVPKTKKSSFMAALAKANLLTKSSGKYLEKALDSSSPFENQQQRKHRIKIAQEKEFAQTISQFNGIEEATVHYDAKEKKGLAQDTIFTASVTVRAKNNKPLTSQQSQIIRNYLAGCIAGLKPEVIYIVDLNLSPEPPVATHLPANFSQIHSGTPNRSPSQVPKELVKQPESFPAGTLAIVGTALVAGCVALLRRKIGTESTDRNCVSEPTKLDIQIPSEPPDKSQTSLTELPGENLPNSAQNFGADDHTAKARLLLAGQSDYSHLIPNQQTDGIELTTMAVHSDSESTQPSNPNADKDNSRLFDFVRRTNSEDLFEIIINEDAGVIATVFSHLSPEKSADLLSRFPDATQLRILLHLGDSAQTSNASTKKISKAIAKRLSANIKRNKDRKEGMQAVSDLLHFVDTEQRSKLLKKLRLKGADLTRRTDDQIKSAPQSKPESSNGQQPVKTPTNLKILDDQTPEIVSSLSGDQLCELFAAVDPRDAVLALSQWDPKVTQTLTESMQSQDVIRLEKSLRNIRGQRVNKSTSCLKVVETAERLIASGKFITS